MQVPSFKEDHISQLPALKLLINMGWHYLSPQQCAEARGHSNAQVLLEPILKRQLQRINRIRYRGQEHAFSETNVNKAISALRLLPAQEGYIAANKSFYELITLGKSFEQQVQGAQKSFSFRYIDWQEPANNVYHIVEEFSVLRSASNEHYRPDIVLFVNGIPMVVMECKSPKLKEPIDKAIEQQMRNQQKEGIRGLYYYSNLVIGLATHHARFATTATEKEFWSIWKELFKSSREEQNWLAQVHELKNRPLPPNEQSTLFKHRYQEVQLQFDLLEQEEVLVTEQDKLLYSLCRPQRLLNLCLNFILYDDGIKKIARYQQFFAVQNTLKRVAPIRPNGKRQGGVLWHTQGSGKSLTMVMLAQLIASHPDISNPQIVLVTDRIDLDSQITDTFSYCGMPVLNAEKGASQLALRKLQGESLTEKELLRLNEDKSLLYLLHTAGDSVITTLIHKFEAAVKASVSPFTSPNIFILVDEGHRSQYGSFHVKMQKAFPNGCFIAFTGTPLMKKEKSTAQRFGGLIDVYSITDAVNDGAVVPLLYEGRHNLIEVNDKPLDNFFDKVSEPLPPYGKTRLKRKYSSKSTINKADEVIHARAWDISEHFTQQVQGLHFGGLTAKAQLVAPNKTAAIRYRNYLKEIGQVSCEVLISAPDTREQQEDAFEESEDLVLKFWQAMMDKYGKAEDYETNLINSFKKRDKPEIIIVVDKLLTGFDAPNNYVMYLTRQLKAHTLLQAIARVNRLAPGKKHGIIIDYYGNLENLDSALETYSGSEQYEAADLEGTLTQLGDEVKKLPQAHAEVWDIFKTLRNKYDETAYQELLHDEAVRYSFYEKVSAFARLLKLALSSLEFINHTPEHKVAAYKKDAKFFLGLRVSAKQRYFDELAYKEYEPQVQKLIDKHITTDGEVLRITEMVNIFDKEQREQEVEKLISKAAKADHIASRTIKALSVKMEEDPVYYKKLSRLIRDTIEDYHQHRISEAEYLKRAKEYEDQFHNGRQNDIPENIRDNATAIAIYNHVNDLFNEVLKSQTNQLDVAALMAEGIDALIQASVFEGDKIIVDWAHKTEVEGKIKIEIDDYLFDLKTQMDLDLPFDLIDQLVEESLKVAKLKYK